jgi:hypothetical protein
MNISKNKLFAVVGALLLFLSSNAFATQFEIFGAAPIAFSDVRNFQMSSVGGGLGIGFTSLNPGKSFGVTWNGIVYYDVTERIDAMHSGHSLPFPQNLVPNGLDFSLGITLAHLKTSRVAFPLTLALHSQVALLDGTTQFDFGASGTFGVAFLGKRSSFFIRSLFYFDFSQVLWVHENITNKEEHFGFEKGDKLRSFGIMPQIGFTIPLGKSAL